MSLKLNIERGISVIFKLKSEEYSVYESNNDSNKIFPKINFSTLCVSMSMCHFENTDLGVIGQCANLLLILVGFNRSEHMGLVFHHCQL